MVARPLQDTDSQSGFPPGPAFAECCCACQSCSLIFTASVSKASALTLCLSPRCCYGMAFIFHSHPSGPPPPCNRGDTHPVGHSQVFFGLVGVCEKAGVSARRGRISTPISAICFVPPRGPGVAFPAQVTTKKYGLMKEETFLEPPVMCRRVFMSAAAAVDRLDPLLCW